MHRLVIGNPLSAKRGRIDMPNVRRDVGIAPYGSE